MISVWDIYRVRELHDGHIRIRVEELVNPGHPSADSAIRSARVLGDDAIVRERPVSLNRSKE